MWKYIFKAQFSWVLGFPLGGLRASYTYFQGMGGREELKIPNRARSESPDF